ncbi:MAG: glycosyltransferase [Bacteroidota bacterium]|nr:glycosyltransferase [Bacteroidota bacterium]
MDTYNKTILIICNYFYPAWKAGGPIESLKNLVNALNENLSIFLVCSIYDLHENKPLTGVKAGEWNMVNHAQVRYLQFDEIKYSIIKKLIIERNADAIYTNGLFSMPFVIYPLLIWKIWCNKKSRFILSPRGMLQKGALKSKTLKKRLFICALKLFQLHKNVEWHATDEQECIDIRNHFGKNSRVFIVPNIPKKPCPAPRTITKKPGELKLIYLSLVAEKKNLHLSLKWLKELNTKIVYDIYGPIKDKAYWNICKQLIEDMPEIIKVSYKGQVFPDKVQDKFSEYHSLLLPTKGENFGHAIYECLSVGRPVIISTETPWKNLEVKKAGYDIDLRDEEKFKTAIKTLYAMDENEFRTWSENAHTIAGNYWRENNFKSGYLQLFS